MRLSDLRKTLLDQHAEIRRLVAAVDEAIAQQLPAAELASRLVALRHAVEAHNQAEEATLEPILECIDAWGPQRVEALAGEHRAEHEEVLSQLDPARAGDTAHLKHVLAALLAHMGQEEKTLLTEKLLRDDVIQLDAGD
jgi:hypothetical protein